MLFVLGRLVSGEEEEFTLAAFAVLVIRHRLTDRCLPYNIPFSI